MKHVLAILSLVTVAPLYAHHGNYEYDMSAVVRREGIVTEFHWVNPHSFLVLESTDKSGTHQRLEIEAAGPAGLLPMGVTRRSMRLGERVIAIFRPHRRLPDERGFGVELIWQDGSTTPLHPAAMRPALTVQPGAKARNVFGVWVPRWADFPKSVSSARAWPLTEAGRAASRAYNIKASSRAACQPISAPWLMIHPVVIEVSRSDGMVSFAVDYMEARRQVHLGELPPDNMSGRQGISTGRWEGDTLIIETTGFSEDSWSGIPSGANKRLVEKLSLIDDGASLRYQFEVSDEENLVLPGEGVVYWDYRPDLELSGVPCDLKSAAYYTQ